MSGYTPVFNTIFEGSLCGRYPDTAAWMFFLALADWRGEVDKTPEFIAGVTGMPLTDLKSCIERFMQPDPRSRSQAEEGRKLVLIDNSRDWGWRVVNIGLYRRKASGQDQIADGRNAAKVKRYKERHRETPGDTEGHSGKSPDTNCIQQTSDSNKDPSLRSGGSAQARARATPAVKSKFVPERFEVTDAMREWAKTECPSVDVDAETKKFRDHEFRDPHTDWPRAWRRWMRNAPEFVGRNGGGKKTFDDRLAALRSES